MNWIKIEDQLPIAKFDVYVKNGEKVYFAKYFRKKWYTHSQELHKVTHWAKSIFYPQYKSKSLKSFKKFNKKYRSLRIVKNK